MPVNCQIQGTLYKIMEATISPKGFEKRVFHVKENRGSQIWELQAHQGMANELLRFAPGQEVLCQIEVQGREWKAENGAKVTNTLRCWKIELIDPALEAEVNRAARNIEKLKIKYLYLILTYL